jgi:hypothetical protein
VKLDGDAPFSLQLVRVQNLLAHLPLLDRARSFEKAIGQGGLPMVDVGYDGKVPDVVSAHVE